MISKHIRMYCEDYHLIENYEKAVADETQMWECHHRAETDENLTMEQLIKQSRYFDCKPKELIFLTMSEHSRLHYDSELGKKRKRNISKSLTGEKHPNFGKKTSEETKRKISDSLKGRHWKLVDCKRVWF